MAEPLQTIRTFASLADAREYRAQHGTGGYIFASDDDAVVVLFPPHLTATPVMLHPMMRGLSGTLIA